MAKKKTVERGVASATIREALKAGITKPSEIVEYCSGKGVNVKLSLVNAIKAKEKKKKPRRGRPAQPGRKSKAVAAARNGAAEHGALDAAAEFVRQTGSFDAAHRFLEKLKNFFG